jgi:hypothetical protein
MHKILHESLSYQPELSFLFSQTRLSPLQETNTVTLVSKANLLLGFQAILEKPSSYSLSHLYTLEEPRIKVILLYLGIYLDQQRRTKPKSQSFSPFSKGQNL